MSAYLDTGIEIDLLKVWSIFSTPYGRTTTYAVGRIDSVSLYAGKNGWLVAYFDRRSVTVIRHWAMRDYGLPQLEADDALKLAIQKVVKALGVEWAFQAPKVRYYHWAHPEATRILSFSTGATGVPAALSFQVPVTRTLYEAVWSAYCHSCAIELDGEELDFIRTAGSMLTTRAKTLPPLSLSTFHTIRATGGPVGVAVFLVLK